MYTRFIYNNGSNPYIATTHKNLFKMICKYNLSFIGKYNYMIIDERPKYKKTYDAMQEVLRVFAIDYQSSWSDTFWNLDDLSKMSAFFEEYGKKYGLLREFRENGII